MTGNSLFALPEAVRLVEVGLRDGLQGVEDVVSTEAKVHLAELLVAAGVREIEVASFAHPRVLPQLADAEAVLATVPRPAGVRYRALVPNLRGAQRAASCGLEQIVALTCCDEYVSRINQGRGTEDVLAELPEIAQVAHASGAEFVVGVAMAFFAPGAGPTTAARRDYVVDRAVDAGASGVYLADTVGMSDPVQIADAVRETKARYPDLELGLHLHARNGFALANALAGLAAGVDWLEAAFCGLGGDLWFPGDPDVLGNLATEDLIAFTDAVGVRTGVDADEYEAVTRAAVAATGRPSLDHVTRGGSRASLAEIHWADVLTDYGKPTTARTPIQFP